MSDLRPFPEKEYQSLLRKRKKVKICITISADNEDILYALTRFSDSDSYSALVNRALNEFWSKFPNIIDNAKEDWSKEWSAFRKKRMNTSST